MPCLWEEVFFSWDISWNHLMSFSILFILSLIQPHSKKSPGSFGLSGTNRLPSEIYFLFSLSPKDFHWNQHEDGQDGEEEGAPSSLSLIPSGGGVDEVAPSTRRMNSTHKPAPYYHQEIFIEMNTRMGRRMPTRGPPHPLLPLRGRSGWRGPLHRLFQEVHAFKRSSKAWQEMVLLLKLFHEICAWSQIVQTPRPLFLKYLLVFGAKW